MIAISAAIILAAISITGLSILAFAQPQEQQPQQKFIAQQSSWTDPITKKSSSSAASSLPEVFAQVENSVVQITSCKINFITKWQTNLCIP
jgi:hypothetical protein